MIEKESNSKSFTIAVLPGDGIGQEVIPQGIKVIEAVSRKFGHRFVFNYGLVGGEAIDKKGAALPEETLEICRKSDAILFGAVGGPKWDHLPVAQKPEHGLLDIRHKFDLYANLRPIKVFPSLVNCSSLKPELLKDVDFVIIRELTGGIIGGKPRGLSPTKTGRKAVNTIRYSEQQVTRSIRVSLEVARERKRKLSLVAQDNVLETSRLWRQIGAELQKEYPDVEVEHILPDNCAMQLIRNPSRFDVIAIDNIMMGGMLNDQGAVIMGSMGMTSSAELNVKIKPRRDGEGYLTGAFGLYEPVHGTAPRRTGLRIVNPIATILAVALMLRYTLALKKEANAVETAVSRVLDEGYRTYDIMAEGKRKVDTDMMGKLIAEAV